MKPKLWGVENVIMLDKTIHVSTIIRREDLKEEFSEINVQKEQKYLS